MKDLIERQATIDVLSLGKEILSYVLDDIDVVGTDREKYSWGLELIESYIDDIKELPSAQHDCIECLREIDDYGEEHYVGDNDKMFWDIRSILENSKHSEANNYGESTEIVSCNDCKHH
jgi:antitoxin component HigA of HigAB toxin-antitoxin module